MTETPDLPSVPIEGEPPALTPEQAPVDEHVTMKPGPAGGPDTEDMPVLAVPAGPSISEDTIFTGQLLREVREARRMTLKEVAERTRISVANLSALEDERYEALPNARVYVRGFVRCLAVEIGIDRDHVSRTYLPRWETWFYEQPPSR